MKPSAFQALLVIGLRSACRDSEEPTVKNRDRISHKRQVEDQVKFLAVNVVNHTTWNDCISDEQSVIKMSLQKAGEDYKNFLDPWGREFVASCKNKTIVVYSKGKDGIENTADDIVSYQVPY